ncbi:glutathione S-transferase N-terminal domain-containing protein [Dongia rigui]|uniref:Glutathione S-transferase N-terminal domain-containing protein n=1 Tax=Dongia rigui TaxID=940149 RepID=A0ABU5E1Y0_9PROT|nr:glutathione S-transferase N-terminal domain-containing protein [Dongia rigui]MDY0873617.1 glutathione S-transferase N-terminal domain-containing protein [Dongia rigui]
MIDLYSWATPNGHKAHIMLEETGLPYRLHKVDIGKGEQFRPEFLAINPNNKIPAIVDQDGPGGKPITLFESGAILIYLAEKTGKFLPADKRRRYDVLQWLMFQMGSIGPMYGQAWHFRSVAPERIPYAVDRYTNEVTRLLRVMEQRFKESPYLGDKEFSIADIAAWPWVKGSEKYGQDMRDFPNVTRWIATIAERPAVQRGLNALLKAA